MLQDGECFRYCGQVCVKVRRIAENPGYGLYQPRRAAMGFYSCPIAYSATKGAAMQYQRLFDYTYTGSAIMAPVADEFVCADCGATAREGIDVADGREIRRYCPDCVVECVDCGSTLRAGRRDPRRQRGLSLRIVL